MAGEFLAKYPVVQRPYDDDDPWREWLRRELLTRNDGLWLADGVDRPPVDAQVNLVRERRGRARPYRRQGKTSRAPEYRIVHSGRSWLWPVTGARLTVSNSHYFGPGTSPHLLRNWRSSCLRKTRFKRGCRDPRALRTALNTHSPRKSLMSRGSSRPPYEAKLDETDPLGVTSAVQRLYFTKAINAIRSLKAPGPFQANVGRSRGTSGGALGSVGPQPGA